LEKFYFVLRNVCVSKVDVQVDVKNGNEIHLKINKIDDFLN